jgi:ubiquinone/menaquinone biosynthesis C-methylase UbiE
MTAPGSGTYLHGFSALEQQRLFRQAQFTENVIYRDVDFSDAREILEVGCGVGAQTAILLRRFPNLKTTSIDSNHHQLKVAEDYLSSLSFASGRYTLLEMDGAEMSFESQMFEGAFLCWVLEHVPDPGRLLMEVKRVLKPGARLYVTEVMNSSFFLEPYSPSVWKYWMAFNDYQYEHAGDPFMGAKLGNLLTHVGFQHIQTRVKHWFFDNRHPEKRRVIIDHWTELLLSAAEKLIEAGYTTPEIVESAKTELKAVKSSPNAVFFYAFVQASAQK